MCFIINKVTQALENVWIYCFLIFYTYVYNIYLYINLYVQFMYSFREISFWGWVH